MYTMRTSGGQTPKNSHLNSNEAPWPPRVVLCSNDFEGTAGILPASLSKAMRPKICKEEIVKKIIATALMSAIPFAAAYAQAPDKNSPPQKAMDSATPEMKNPGGSDKEHPPQKAMDSATPDSSGSGASSGEGAAPGAGGTTYNAQDANKAAGPDNKQKIPADNKIPRQGEQKQ